MRALPFPIAGRLWWKPLPVDWRAKARRAARESFPAVPAVALILVVGVASGHVAAAQIAAGGAMSIGFGAFKRVEGSPFPPTLLAGLGTACAAMAGSLLGHSLPALAAATLILGAVTSFFAAVNEGPRWVAMQTAIALVIAGTFPASPLGALARGGLVLAGCAAEVAGVALFQRLLATAPHPFWPILPRRRYLRDIAEGARRELGRNLLHALACGVAVAASLLLSRALGLPKSYWAPVTTLIVLKADYRSIGRRGAWRLVGTFVGGALAGGLGFAHLGPVPSLFVTVALLYLTYALHNAQYALFVGVLTAWLVVMLGLGQHFEATVAWHRAIFTLLGGAVALGAEWPRAALARLGVRRNA